jgi:hypothetical protein
LRLPTKNHLEIDANGTPDAPSYFQHTAGLTFKFGGKDTDGDGIYDKDDACQKFGLKEFNGCPDTDGDGIQDSADACPDVFGLATLNGCQTLTEMELLM